MQSQLILVTGAGGFVGRHLCRYLTDAGYRVRGSMRSDPPPPEAGIEYRASGDIGDEVDWRPLLEDVDAVVHAAARVHIQGDISNTPGMTFRTVKLARAERLERYHRVNVSATAHLAQQAQFAGVRRFVFLSSIKAGEVERAEPDPAGFQPYDITKREAEIALQRIVQSRAMETIILRPPLVYGPGATANFALLVRAVSKGIPLPFGSIRNRRSFIYVGNLCSAIAACLEHPKAPGGIFEISDGPPLSTADFMRAIGKAMGKPARLLPCPPALLRSLGRALGKDAAAESLTGDLVADDRAIRERLGWRAPTSITEALKATLTTREREAS